MKPSRPHRISGFLVVLLMAFAASCRQPEATPDVLVITVDTARADRFSYAGKSPVSTPNIDALAAESTAFLQAVSTAPLTLVSHASLFTGKLPPAHGVRNNGTYRLDESAITLAELLQRQGYATGAFVAAAVLDSRFGLDQGFEHYDDAVYENRHHPERPGGEVVRAALEWLDGQTGRPTLAWVHLFDPHDPHTPPEPERSSYPLSPYDGEIAYVDRVVGELLAGYRRHERYRRLIVLFTADHGESLGEHGEETHGVFLYDATLTVPMLIRMPGVGAGRRISTQVQLVDLLPTLVDRLQLEMPPGVQGRSLLPYMQGDRLEPRPAYSESFLPRENYGWSELKSLRAGGWKLVLGSEAELYDLRADPRESRDLAGVARERVDGMKNLLERLLAESGSATAERLELDDETRRQLAALGYLSTSPQRSGAVEVGPREELPDPRLRIHLIRARSRATELFDWGFHQDAVERCRAILEEDPSNLLVRQQVVTMLLATGGFREAEELLSALSAEHPSVGWVWRRWATLQERLGRPAQALSAWRAAYTVDPGDRDARARSWELLLAADDRDQLLAEAGAALAAEPADGSAKTARAVATWRGENPALLVSELEAASRADPTEPEILSALAEIHIDNGDYSLALPLQARAQTLAPDSDRHAIRLARTLAALGRPGDVRQVLRNIRKRGMFEPEAWLLLGEACLALGDGPCAASALGRLGRLVPGPLLPWLRSGPPGGQGGRRIVEILALAGRLGEALSLREARDGPAEAADFYRVLLLPEAGRRAAALTGARALLARGDAGAARSALEPLYRSYPVDLEVSLTYAEISAHLADDEEVREILTRLAERLVGGEGPPFVPELRLEDRQRATEILTRTGGASWQRLVYSNALHAYGLGAFLVPDDPRPHYNLGLAWERTGDYGDALRAFDRTLALSPDFPRAREHRQAMAHATRRPAGGAAR